MSGALFILRMHYIEIEMGQLKEEVKGPLITCPTRKTVVSS
jgi:hypothetical protein